MKPNLSRLLLCFSLLALSLATAALAAFSGLEFSPSSPDH